MTQIEDRVRSGLRAEAKALAEDGRTAKSTSSDRPRLLSGAGVAVAMAVVVLVIFGGASLLTGGGGGVADEPVPTLPARPAPSNDPDSPFVGTWVTADLDGSTPTATIEVSTDGVVEIVVVDDYASVCSGAPSTMTGSGRLDGDTVLLIPTPVLTCDDGSGPQALSGPPLEEQLQDLTFTRDPGTDTLTDNLGSVWTREGAESPIPEPTIPGIVWPQTSIEEVQEAQQLADAGDPGYTWQVDPELGWKESYEQDRSVFESSEIVARFLRAELGWEDFQYWPGGHGNLGFNYLEDNAFIRCATDGTNPLYPNDPKGGGCAPTIDEFRYEWVSIDLIRLDSTTLTFDSGRDDPSGIWVVSAWRMLPPMEQVPPRSEAETAAALEDFLQARIEGEGAEKYVDVPVENAAGEIVWDEPQTGDIPLLYATTTGSAYERSEFEVVAGPTWPDGEAKVKVRLFARGGRTVVEQLFLMNRENGQLGIQYCSIYPSGLCGSDAALTTENGQAVPVP